MAKGQTRQQGDYAFLAYVALLLVFGIVMLTSASSVVRPEDSFYFVKRQLLVGVIPGIMAFLVMARCSYHLLKKFASPLFYVALLLLIAVLIPGVGQSFNTGANSWIVVAGFSFQPAELAKLALILFMGMLTYRLGPQITDLKEGFAVAFGLGAIPLGLVILQPDIGTAAIIFALLLVTLFVAGARWAHLFTVFGVAVMGFLLLLAVSPFHAQRFTTFMRADQVNASAEGYHISQAKIAVRSGGLLGLGLGRSKQKYQYLPEVHADSIFAVMAEELGFLFMVGYLALLAMISRRSIIIAKGAPDLFGRVVVIGIMTWFFVQSAFNIAAILGMMPLTGVPLPMVSHGGTALLLMCTGMGIIFSISKSSRI